MHRRVAAVVVMGVAVCAAMARGAAADVLAVPDAVRQLRQPLEETHVLRARDGVTVGEQHSRAVVAADRLTFDIATRFTSGEDWSEHGELGLADGFRARRFTKVVRRGGRVVEQQDVDFTSGTVAWLVDGVHAERTLTLAPDTYIGPMLAMVLGGVAVRPAGTTTLHALVFRPDPSVFTLRADVVDGDDASVPNVTEPTAKLRVKPDLGALENALFAKLIPTHYFWFTRETPPTFVAFAGALGNGLDVVMTPESGAATKTARAE